MYLFGDTSARVRKRISAGKDERLRSIAPHEASHAFSCGPRTSGRGLFSLYIGVASAMQQSAPLPIPPVGPYLSTQAPLQPLIKHDIQSLPHHHHCIRRLAQHPR
jgi:hypothetical protein